MLKPKSEAQMSPGRRDEYDLIARLRDLRLQLNAIQQDIARVLDQLAKKQS